MNFHPHEYQEIAIQRIIDHTHYGLLLDMGLGKTVSTLIAIEQLMYDYFDIKKVLLIAPKKVAESTWAQETKNGVRQVILQWHLFWVLKRTVSKPLKVNLISTL